jgi:arylsulfatase A
MTFPVTAIPILMVITRMRQQVKHQILIELAEKGMRFTDFYAGAAVCSPSRAALITGRNATRVGIYNWIPENGPMHLRSEEITIAELLKKKITIQVILANGILLQRVWGNLYQMTRDLITVSLPTITQILRMKIRIIFTATDKPVGQLEGYAAGLVVDEAIKWLETKKDQESPFYINVWFNEPHTRVAAPEKFTSRHSYNKEYYGCIENMDHAIGELINYLELNGLDKNTIIMFTSDNGSQWDHSNDPLRGEKCFNYEGGYGFHLL